MINYTNTYTYIHYIYIYIYMQNYNDAIKKDERRLLKKYTPPNFIWKVVCERELETEQRQQQMDLPSPSGHRYVSSSSSWTAHPGPGGPASLRHILIPASSLQLIWYPTHWESRRPLLLGGSFLYHVLSQLVYLQLTDFLFPPSNIIVQSPTQSLEWHVWSSSSRNNCHAVQRSPSSGASVFECTVGFYLVPYRQPSPPTQFLLITAIGMCHFLPVHHFGMACLAGSKVNIQQYHLRCRDCFRKLLSFRNSNHWPILVQIQTLTIRVETSKYSILKLCDRSFKKMVGWLVGSFYGVSTFVGYLTANPFLCK